MMRLTIYLLHATGGCWRAPHYIGACLPENLLKRLQAHRNGTGAGHTRALRNMGAHWQLARTWDATEWADERRIKKRFKARFDCPVCCGDKPAEVVLGRIPDTWRPVGF